MSDVRRDTLIEVAMHLCESCRLGRRFEWTGFVWGGLGDHEPDPNSLYPNAHTACDAVEIRGLMDPDGYAAAVAKREERIAEEQALAMRFPPHSNLYPGGSYRGEP